MSYCTLQDAGNRTHNSSEVSDLRWRVIGRQLGYRIRDRVDLCSQRVSFFLEHQSTKLRTRAM